MPFRLSLRRVEQVDVDSNFLAIESAFSSTLTTSGSQTATLPTGGTFTLVDHLGAKIFEVRDDGSVHIRSAHTVTADL